MNMKLNKKSIVMERSKVASKKYKIKMHIIPLILQNTGKKLIYHKLIYYEYVFVYI